MNANCRVRLFPQGQWHRGILTDEIEPRLGPCVIVKGKARWPRHVDCVAVFSSCPVALLDAAVEAGFWVVGQPKEVTHE